MKKLILFVVLIIGMMTATQAQTGSIKLAALEYNAYNPASNTWSDWSYVYGFYFYIDAAVENIYIIDNGEWRRYSIEEISDVRFDQYEDRYIYVRTTRAVNGKRLRMRFYMDRNLIYLYYANNHTQAYLVTEVSQIPNSM